MKSSPENLDVNKLLAEIINTLETVRKCQPFLDSEQYQNYTKDAANPTKTLLTQFEQLRQATRFLTHSLAEEKTSKPRGP
jgi:hypothetical protein